MRSMHIQFGEIVIGGRTKPAFCQHTGFAKNQKIAHELLSIAGFPDEAHPCLADSYYDTSLGLMFDAERCPPVEVKPAEGECWVFVLGEKLLLN